MPRTQLTNDAQVVTDEYSFDGWGKLTGSTGIYKWAVAKEALLLKRLDLPYGLPFEDVIRRVLSALKVEAFQSCFVT